MQKYSARRTLQNKRRQLKERRADRKARIKRDVERYGKAILQSEEMRQAFRQPHHQWSTVGEHTMRVTSSSVWLSYALQKLHIKVDIPAVIVGSLCHDLGILGRDDKYRSNLECCRKHPKDSVEVARHLVGELPEETEEIIRRHMWPLGGTRMPNSIEGLVVSASDKYNSAKDLVMGSELKHTGVKHLLSSGKTRLDHLMHKKL